MTIHTRCRNRVASTPQIGTRPRERVAEPAANASPKAAPWGNGAEHRGASGVCRAREWGGWELKPVCAPGHTIATPGLKHTSDVGEVADRCLTGLARASLFIARDPASAVTSTWADLFDRADRYDRTEADVIDTLDEYRDDE